ncbi:phosphoribosylformylglycinamidine synthase subunit PurS [Candidatus Liberibacter asiaticus]|uniref:Phosphoribosylformylglycinamidine synthase subunit PurS n=3 Tax=Liberibacter asiaticus TaxID=34021 RepID=C6XGE2_LIBAP|nr:phosphoribosylformylglycinamidine synthase subunit PurS [Candidatus Liberibacter asiaticus]ACT57445.1 phosphoribosylformylglycinamidine synthase, PurS protein [Candidatus Liberibacter asiaticus str. psy62]AGH17208.1 phosphoribosylformylglycinamidine synthase, PurS protein [Candidatus Liberibacter asiaticus str. gxpsy]ALK07507.1 phosphoribosylformylglycinamidine synthase subunit PurS [Candidatus Liberibacter asiaticus]ASK52997.1 phosphoribosylformylglycinamidine synthase subunit PurS [Candida
MIKANVVVKLKKDVLDPQGKALKTALSNIGFHNINQIRQGKIFDIEMDETLSDIAEEELESICQNLLANPVIEDYDIKVQKSSS